jgi:hypothetical protein
LDDDAASPSIAASVQSEEESEREGADHRRRGNVVPPRFLVEPTIREPTGKEQSQQDRHDSERDLQWALVRLELGSEFAEQCALRDKDDGEAGDEGHGATQCTTPPTGGLGVPDRAAQEGDVARNERQDARRRERDEPRHDRHRDGREQQ